MFAEVLNDYITKIGCTNKELAEKTGLSESTISRYRNGDRTPDWKDDTLSSLAEALSLLSNESIEQSSIYDSLLSSVKNDQIDYDHFSDRFDTLCTVLEISTKDLATFMNYDVSFLYRIRSGERRPNDLDSFVIKMQEYIIGNYSASDYKTKLENIFGAYSNNNELLENIRIYLSENSDSFSSFSSQDEAMDSSGTYSKNEKASGDSFLGKLDSFNLDEFISAIHFNELKIPTVPFSMPKSKHYYGLEEMKTAELDFFKANALSKKGGTVFMHSDMPLEDMAEDNDFNKKWMFGIAAAIKKGMHINIIHNLERPWNELMLGLEAWIPIYMTGQVSPFYIQEANHPHFRHLLYVSDSLALSGECINGHHDKGSYYLTNNHEEKGYYAARASQLLSIAKPLMNIYDEKKKNELSEKLRNRVNVNSAAKAYKNLISAPPLYSLSEALFEEIAIENELSEEERKEFLLHIIRVRTDFENIISVSHIEDIISPIENNCIASGKAFLSLAELFPKRPVKYSKKTLEAHLEATKKLAEQYENYSVSISDNGFKNIDMLITSKEDVIIKKTATPTIVFEIKHPQLVEAIENYKPPVVSD